MAAGAACGEACKRIVNMQCERLERAFMSWLATRVRRYPWQRVDL